VCRRHEHGERPVKAAVAQELPIVGQQDGAHGTLPFQMFIDVIAQRMVQGQQGMFGRSVRTGLMRRPKSKLAANSILGGGCSHNDAG
jgi:hypothetical protein